MPGVQAGWSLGGRQDFLTAPSERLDAVQAFRVRDC